MDVVSADEAGELLPVVHIKNTVLDGVHAHAGAVRWHRALLEAGLYAELSALPADEDAPQHWLSAVQGLHGELQGLEDRHLELISEVEQPWFRDVPPWTALAVPLFLAWLAVELGQDAQTLRAKGAMMLLVYGGAGLLGVLLLAYGAVVSLQRRRARQEELAHVKDALPRVRQQLHQGARATAGRAFVARVGGRLLVSVPDLERLDPDTTAAVLAEVRRLQADPPEVWAPLHLPG